MPTYQQNKPAATDQLSVSQGDLQHNYQAIKALIDINHSTFNGGASPEGKHIKADYTNEATRPGPEAHPTVAANDVTIYNNGSELYVKKTGAAGVVGIPMTIATKAETGTTTLPSGIILKWGMASTLASGLRTITFATPFPTAVAIVNAGMTLKTGSSAVAADGYVRIYTYNATELRVVGFLLDATHTRQVVDFCWFAIGY